MMYLYYMESVKKLYDKGLSLAQIARDLDIKIGVVRKCVDSFIKE